MGKQSLWSFTAMSQIHKSQLLMTIIDKKDSYKKNWMRVLKCSSDFVKHYSAPEFNFTKQFKSSFSALLAPKKVFFQNSVSPKFKYKKAAGITFAQKMLRKYWWNWHLFFRVRLLALISFCRFFSTFRLFRWRLRSLVLIRTNSISSRPTSSIMLHGVWNLVEISN